jgi:hypothetical protein
MKTKLTVKKLKLMKETLRDLTVKDAGLVKGGPCGPRTFYNTLWGCKGKTKNCQVTKRPAC